ncbi:MAG: ubiquitin-like protein Pup [Actinomycetota bacterium]|jgi:hypothetical protein
MNRQVRSRARSERTTDFRRDHEARVTDRSAGSLHEVDELLDEIDAVLDEQSALTRFLQRPGQ